MRIEALEPNMAAGEATGNATALQLCKDYPVLLEALSMGIITGLDDSKTISPLKTKASVDLHHVLEQLDLAQNKFWVLRLMGRSDWFRIIGRLPKKLMLNALKLFDKDKLMRFIMWLPPEMLLKVILRMFSIEQLVRLMPTRELMRILHSHKLTNSELLKGLRRMNPVFVQLLLFRIYGDRQFDKMPEAELWQWIMRTNKMRLMEALKTMPFKALVPMVTALVKRDPELLLLLSEDFIFRLFDKMDKASLVEACQDLPEDMILKMLMNLPDASLLEAAAQIDDQSLGDYMLSSQLSLLMSLGAAA